MKSTTCRWVAYYVAVPKKWPVKVGTNLFQEEVFKLESIGFCLEDKVDAAGAMVLEAMLEDRQTPVLNVAKVEPEEDVLKDEPGVDVMNEAKSCPLSAQRSRLPAGNYRPTFRDGKRYRFVPKPTIQHYKKMEDSRDISCIIRNFTMVPEPGYGVIFSVETPRSIENQEVYQVTLSNFLACTCLGFVSMKGAALGNGQKKWILCKHLYYVLQKRCLVTSFDKFIHCPTWTLNQVKTILDRIEMAQLLD